VAIFTLLFFNLFIARQRMNGQRREKNRIQDFPCPLNALKRGHALRSDYSVLAEVFVVDTKDPP
jgi:hypothetical protein